MNLKGPPHDRGEDKTHWAPIERESPGPLKVCIETVPSLERYKCPVCRNQSIDKELCNQ